MKRFSWLLLIGSAAVLSACGGGGGGGSGSVATTTPPPVETTPPPVQAADFTTFVKDQWMIPDNGAPSDVADTKFNFADDDNPKAFDDTLKAEGQ
jgi:hypothetical protein